ncbi:MAG: Ig-like domain-containing protein [Bacteroides xylanisolvens]
MKKNCKYYIYGSAIMLSLALGACADDKNYGETGEEAIILNSVEIAKTGYEIKDGSICLEFDQVLELKYTLIPENADDPNLVWASSNEKVATVSQKGVIIAGKTAGTTIISVKPAIGFGSQTATPIRNVTVIDKMIPIQSLTMKTDNPEDGAGSTTVLAGENRQFVVAAMPENHTYEKYTWLSSNPEVATVDETGFVETLKEGNATINLTSRDGGKASTSYSFTVLPSVLPTAVEFINFEKLQSLAYGETVDLHDYVKLTPENATFALIKWSTDNKLVSVNNRGILKIGLSITPSEFKLNGHTINLTASNQEGQVLNNAQLTTAGGHFIHNFKDGLSPFMFDKKPNMSYIEYGTHMHVNLGVQSATDFRQDLKVANTGNAGGFMLSTTQYKYFAMKFRRSYYYDVATDTYSRYAPGKTGNKFAFNLTPTTGANVGHWEGFKQLDVNSCSLINEVWDGEPKIYVWKLDEHSNLVNATDAETGLVDIKNADIIVADVKAEQETSYDIYWVGTFSSLEEIKAYYLANE